MPGNAGELRALHRAGVFGFKCFLVPSGVPEFENVGEGDLRAALPILAEIDAPLLVHAELPGPIERAAKRLAKSDPRSYATWLRSRTPRPLLTKALSAITAKDFRGWRDDLIAEGKLEPGARSEARGGAVVGLVCR